MSEQTPFEALCGCGDVDPEQERLDCLALLQWIRERWPKARVVVAEPER